MHIHMLGYLLATLLRMHFSHMCKRTKNQHIVTISEVNNITLSGVSWSSGLCFYKVWNGYRRFSSSVH